MTPFSPAKKARKQQELDALVFSVLASFRQQGPMQWSDWFQTTKARRGKRGLGPGTFSQTMKRLVANGQVQVDGNGWYRIADNAVVENVSDDGGGLTGAGTRADAEDGRFSEASEVSRKAEAEIKKLRTENGCLRAENKRLLDWILGSSDALTAVQSVYQDPEASDLIKVKAAAAALPFERPRLSVAVSVRSTDVLGECLDAGRAAKTINPPKTIDHEP